ncbi:hypothetical protein DICVIV_14067 [Dictyocaulus viviparus]|uniref:Uncharacterized protein n=1 Tax=Dictyocaulus viviparus TaxID=29172 RepID=A0A0D8X655_DICVI|nr:hypothetical protein DICVIV_14067 [Dictyocaulus viviparus]
MIQLIFPSSSTALGEKLNTENLVGTGSKTVNSYNYQDGQKTQLDANGQVEKKHDSKAVHE